MKKINDANDISQDSFLEKIVDFSSRACVGKIVSPEEDLWKIRGMTPKANLISTRRYTFTGFYFHIYPEEFRRDYSIILAYMAFKINRIR